MFEALGQVTYTYSSSSSSNEGAAAVIAAFFVAWLVIILPIMIFTIVAAWKVFTKAGVEGWKAIIPIYNYWVAAEISGKPGWWGLAPLLGVIPFFGSIAAFVVMVVIAFELAKSFGKDPVFGLLLAFLSPIGLGILAFGSAKYVGPGGSPAGGNAGPSKPVAAA